MKQPHLDHDDTDDVYCICGRALPCRHEDESNHGLLSYYQREGPEGGGPIDLANRDDLRRAYIALRMRAEQLGVQLPTLDECFEE